MFEVGVLRFKSQFNNSVGEVLEALLYYNRIHVLFSDVEVGTLIQQLGLKNFEAIVRIPHLTVSIFPEIIASLNEPSGIFSEHSGVIACVTAEPDGKPIKIRDLALRNISTTSGEKIGRKLENLILRYCRISKYEKLFGFQVETNEVMFSTVKNKATLEPFINIIAQKNEATIDRNAFEGLNPSVYLNDAKKIITLNGELDRVFVGGNRENTNWSNVLVEVHDYWIENYISSSLRCDLFSNNFYTQVASTHLNEVFKKSLSKQNSIVEFQNNVFENGKYFAEAIDSGEISISEAIKLIMKYSKLREWVGGMPPGSELMQEYCSKLLEDDSAISKSGKTIMRTAFAAGGAAIDGGFATGMVANLGLDFAQSFFQEKLLKRWSPAVFVKGLKKRIG